MSQLASQSTRPGFADAPQDETAWIDPAAPRQLKHWTIYRSGAALSVSGIDSVTLRTVTLTQIGMIEPRNGKIIVTAQGSDWELVL